MQFSARSKSIDYIFKFFPRIILNVFFVLQMKRLRLQQQYHVA
jgi:hypothetical protein